MINAVAKNTQKLQIPGADAQGVSPPSADSARFTKTLNDLLMSDTAQPKPTDIGFAKGVTNINAALTKPPAAKEPAKPLREASERIDVVAKTKLTAEGQLSQKAHELVGTTFYATLLKQMHDSPFKSELFSGGRGGEAFGGMYDQVLTQRMSQRGAERLVRPIVKKFEKSAADAYERQKNQTEKSLNEAKTDVPSNLRA